jgi:hypothetical protein
MKPPDFMKKFNITNETDALNCFNGWVEENYKTTKYRIISSDSKSLTVSNVPDLIYKEQRVKKYLPQTGDSRYDNDHFINFLHGSFDYAHHNFPELSNGYEDRKVFHLNQCYDNAIAVYNILHSLTQLNDLPVSSPNSICFGFVTRKILPGALIGNAIFNIQEFTVHDWHCWNKINDFLIDISLYKNGGIFPFGSHKNVWEKAENHIFKTHPETIEYFGIDFIDHTQFISLVNEILSEIII